MRTDQAAPVQNPTPALDARGISKSFGGKWALRDLSITIGRGEIVGLVGQNGSGKSTFIKVLAGLYTPDEATSPSVRLGGREVSFPVTRSKASEFGLAFVHQDLGLLADFSVLENVRMTSFEKRAAWRIPWTSERRRVTELLRSFELSVNADQLVRDLTQVERAEIAIVRAYDTLQRYGYGLLVLDEPTASLPRDSAERLFRMVREVANRGFGVLFVSHRLEELFRVTSRVVVLRDGELVDSVATSELDQDDLVRRILGFSLDNLYPESHHGESRGVAVRISDVAGHDVASFSLEVKTGEVVGLTGLLGAGWDSLPYLLFGSRPADSGTLEVGGTEVDLTRITPHVAMQLGCALVPADRIADGSLQSASVRENLTITTVMAHFIGGRLRQRAERRLVASLLDDYEVKPREPDAEMASLSGGNQQKVVMAKWMETYPSLLLLHEPTQGVDVGARAQIFERIANAVELGMSVLLASSDYEDLAHLCDRVLVFRHGEVMAELSGSALTKGRIAEQCLRQG